MTYPQTHVQTIFAKIHVEKVIIILYFLIQPVMPHQFAPKFCVQ